MLLPERISQRVSHTIQFALSLPLSLSYLSPPYVLRRAPIFLFSTRIRTGREEEREREREREREGRFGWVPVWPSATTGRYFFLPPSLPPSLSPLSLPPSLSFPLFPLPIHRLKLRDGFLLTERLWAFLHTDGQGRTGVGFPIGHCTVILSFIQPNTDFPRHK